MKKINIDWTIFAIVSILSVFGLIINFSANSVISLSEQGDINFYFQRHVMYLVIGIFVMIFMAMIDHYWIRKMIWVLNGVTIVLNAMTYVPSLRISAYGADRWLSIAGVTFQPSEIAKITVILTLAYLLKEKCDKGTLSNITPFKEGFLPVIIYIGGYALFILSQNHLSAAGVIVILGMTLLAVAGLRKVYFALIGLLGLVFAGIAVIAAPYRMQRLTGFTDPYENMLDEGWQIIQSWFGLGSGGIFGLGLGMGRQKFTWLPEAHTDFIFGVIGEELGMMGSMFVIVLFLGLFMRGLVLASEQKNLYALFVITGVSTLFFIHFVINVAVVTGLFPVTGITLPFISYGGTSIVILFAAIGLMFSSISDDQRKG